MDRHDNVFLSDTAETYDFSSTPKPGGELQIPFRTNRQSHSDKLVAQFREAQNHFKRSWVYARKLYYAKNV